MSEKNITFEDLPKAMSWMMDKLNKLDSKIDSLNNIPQVRPVDQWMNLKELCIKVSGIGGTDRLRMDELPPDSVS